MNRHIGIGLLQAAVFIVLSGAVLFGLAGRWDLPFFWAYLASWFVLFVSAIRTVDPDLGSERRRPGPGGTDYFTRWAAGPVMLAHMIVAGLDVGRYHWSDTVRWPLQIAGLAIHTGGFGIVLRAMAVNRFFSPVVRFQSDRGHRVVSAGPYGWVRHPGYLGMIVALPASALALGSWLSMLPALAFSALMLRRAIIEDRFLLEKLEGYHAYAESVRYRLVPGIW
jgi:protein-S-isoprenylcysteine O-methyltransferase Ste14